MGMAVFCIVCRVAVHPDTPKARKTIKQMIEIPLKSSLIFLVIIPASIKINYFLKQARYVLTP